MDFFDKITVIALINSSMTQNRIKCTMKSLSIKRKVINSMIVNK